MKNNTIGLGMIVKADDKEAEHLRTCLASLKGFVDELQITVTGHNEKVSQVIKESGATESNFEWIDDFSAARNFNRKQVKSDWYLWLDADDVLRRPENLRKLVEYGETNKTSGFYVFYEYGHDKNGNCIDAHWKAQLLKNDASWEWKGAIHEDALPVLQVNWEKTDWITRVHNSNETRTKESYERNLRILLKERERDPKEPRTLFYLGRAYAGAGRVQEAVDALQEYLTLSGWDSERYEAMLLIGDVLVSAGQYDDALRAYNDAILEKESYYDAYIKKAAIYLMRGEWNSALFNYKTALERNEKEGETAYNPLLIKRDVWAGIGVCYLNLGKLEDANKAVQMALKTDPKFQEALDLKNIIDSERAKFHVSDAYVEIARALRASHEEDKILALLHSYPDALRDNEMYLSLKHTYMKPKKWGDKTIAIFCGATAEAWGPESLNGSGVGGSETAVIELSKRLASMGWEVTVYNEGNWPSEGKEIDGVRWQNYWTFNTDDEFNVLWAWRLPALFDYDVQAELSILDLHDVMNPVDFTEDRLKKIDKIFVKTQYHRSLYPNIKDEKFVVVGNGIDPARWEEVSEERNPHRFIYSSTPNRGLDIVLDMWPRIREKIKDAELHIFYGWNTYYRIEKNNPERIAWMRKIQAKVESLKDNGVFDHGRVGQKELAKEQLKSSFWIYPTYFPEIHCITACEMQAAGVIPLTSGYAALAETQQSGISMPGSVYDETWQAQFIDELVQATEDKEWQKAEREKAQESAKQFSWNRVATVWNEEINTWTTKKSKQ